MIHHYHGSPIWGGAGSVCKIAVTGAGSFISFERPDQINLSLEAAIKIAIDNGAFSHWRKNNTERSDWTGFYQWLMRFYHHEKTEFFVIPDVIEGGEEENDRLIRELPSIFREKAAPVWHLHESLERLVRLCEEWSRVCFGSSGQYAAIRTARWHRRMSEAFTEIYIKRQLRTKIHGLRMLDGRVLGNYPLDTADSTNLACNVPKTEQKYPELTLQLRAMGCSELQVKEGRCAVLKHAIESVTPPTIEQWINSAAQAA
ncbi:hypothetical protein ABP77_002604 [Salmonella enterica subsp. enterica serovar Telelkebir]|nr:hypothetical protein [Salmonella enterica subsp. enterica serovar Telelkebir]